MSEPNTDEQPVTMDEIFKAYAVALQAYDDADKRFRADPTPFNVAMLHRWLDRLVLLRDEIGRSTRLTNALRGAEFEPTIRKIAKELSS